LNNPLKIAVTGPESTGKSLISEQLADHYTTVWVPEFARVYLLQIDRPYTYDDILEIAKGQQKSEQALVPIAGRLMFSDTELLVTKIWCEVKYGKRHPWIEAQLHKQHYDLYLLMDIDLPWEYDPMREHPESRDFLFDLYKKKLNEMQVNYRIVSGLGEERLKNAVAIVDELLVNKSDNKPL
jgi:NadR type nicotinamide-nucleotide adenylyltransferase